MITTADIERFDSIRQELKFCLPLDLKKLENEKVKIVPFVSNYDSFASSFVSECVPSTYDFLPYGPFQDVSDFTTWYDKRFRVPGKDTEILLAIVAKAGVTVRKKTNEPKTTRSQTDAWSSSPSVSQPGDNESEFEEFTLATDTFAGTTGYLCANPVYSSVEIGLVTILPRFQRTFIDTHAHGLLLRAVLDPLDQGGLGMRRVDWQAFSGNLPSINAAKRLGFRFEGMTRWQRTLPQGNTASTSRDGTEREGKADADGEKDSEAERMKLMPSRDWAGNILGPGRTSACLSMCWDDWLLDGGREKVDEMMKRTR